MSISVREKLESIASEWNASDDIVGTLRVACGGPDLQTRHTLANLEDGGVSVDSCLLEAFERDFDVIVMRGRAKRDTASPPAIFVARRFLQIPRELPADESPALLELLMLCEYTAARPLYARSSEHGTRPRIIGVEATTFLDRLNASELRWILASLIQKEEEIEQVLGASWDEPP